MHSKQHQVKTRIRIEMKIESIRYELSRQSIYVLSFKSPLFSVQVIIVSVVISSIVLCSSVCGSRCMLEDSRVPSGDKQVLKADLFVKVVICRQAFLQLLVATSRSSIRMVCLFEACNLGAFGGPRENLWQ